MGISLTLAGFVILLVWAVGATVAFCGERRRADREAASRRRYQAQSFNLERELNARELPLKLLDTLSPFPRELLVEPRELN